MLGSADNKLTFKDIQFIVLGSQEKIWKHLSCNTFKPADDAIHFSCSSVLEFQNHLCQKKRIDSFITIFWKVAVPDLFTVGF